VLLVNEGITAVIIALEIVRRGFTAQITIDALVVDVVFARDVFRILVSKIGHKIKIKLKTHYGGLAFDGKPDFSPDFSP
jgi:hypothetical protein